MSKAIIVIFVIIIIGAGYWFYQSASPTEEPTLKEQSCINSGGTVSTSLCCKSTSDFPNLCLIGPCGCSPDNSHEIKICDCGPDKCFNGNECVIIEEDEIANWETYRNKEYGFEVKYPKDWETTININKSEMMYLLIVSLEKVDITQEKLMLPGDNLEGATYNIALTIKSNPQNYSIKDYLLKDDPLESREKIWEEEFEEIIIGDNLRGIKYTIFAAPSSGPCTVVTISHESKIYKFWYCAIAYLETHTKFIEVFNQMLSTFRFLE